MKKLFALFTFAPAGLRLALKTRPEAVEPYGERLGNRFNVFYPLETV